MRVQNCIERQAHLLQRLVLSSLVNDHISSTFLHLLLDEAKEVFLVHARGSVDVSVHLVKWGRGEESGGGKGRGVEGRGKRMMGEERGGEGRGGKGAGGRRGRQKGKREMEEELHTTRYQL